MIEEIKIDRLEELIHEMMIKIRNTSVTNSAEGNPIEIENAAAAPLLKCVSAITGSQDLHGYDQPWVGGAGKNKLPLTVSGIKSANASSAWSGNAYTLNGVTFTIETDGDDNVTGIKANGTASGGSPLLFIGDYADFNGSYILTGCPTGGAIDTYRLDFRTSSSVPANETGTGVNVTVENISARGVIRIENGYTANNLLFKPMIRLATVTDPTFSPYSNICPITAYSTGSVEVEDEDEQSSTYAATFTDPIYQGSIDFVAKKTTATWGYIASYDGETLPGRWISDRDEYAAGTTPTTGAEVAYELESAAVETVTVSNAPVSAVHGYNKIESSTGEMEVTYITEDFEPLVPTT